MFTEQDVQDRANVLRSMTVGIPFSYLLDAARNHLTSVEEQAAILNRNMALTYKNKWAIFEQEFLAGRQKAVDAPVPPIALVLSGVEIVTGKERVCPMPPIPDKSEPAQGTVDINFKCGKVRQGILMYGFGPNDRATDGQVEEDIKGPDGKFHTYRRFWGLGGPNTGGWEQIA